MWDKIIALVLAFFAGKKQADKADKKELEQASSVKPAKKKEYSKLLVLALLVLCGCATKSNYCVLDTALKFDDPYVLGEDDLNLLANHNKRYYCLCDKKKAKELDCFK